MSRMFTLKKLSFPLMVCLVLHVFLYGQVTNNVEPQKENGILTRPKKITLFIPDPLAAECHNLETRCFASSLQLVSI